MTVLNLESLSSAEMILHYVVECRGRGHFLPYKDHQIIEEWLSLTPNPDMLLVILSEVLPDYFERDRQAVRPPRSLSGVHSRVQRRLKDQAMGVALQGSQK